MAPGLGPPSPLPPVFNSLRCCHLFVVSPIANKHVDEPGGSSFPDWLSASPSPTGPQFPHVGTDVRPAACWAPHSPRWGKPGGGTPSPPLPSSGKWRWRTKPPPPPPPHPRSITSSGIGAGLRPQGQPQWECPAAVLP